jgi:uncharacterized protein
MLQSWLILLAVLLGHFGFWLIWFNRINATGLKRYVIKRIEKGVAALALCIPVLVYWAHVTAINQWLFRGQAVWPENAPIFTVWGIVSLATFFLAGPLWLWTRRGLRPPKHLLEEVVDHIDVAAQFDQPLVIERIFERCWRLPGNQITDLTVTHKLLELPRAVKGVDGMKIGHLSDIHLTGKISQLYYDYAIEKLLAAAPDLIVISGDIIDYDRCLCWLEPVLGKLRAPLGCCFVLGNHDRRLSDIDGLVESLTRLGLHDLGVCGLSFRLSSGTMVRIMGNENPWFDRHPEGDADSPEPDANTELRIGVSHSPDQIPWARAQRLDLMLAGHTHGGQIRIPGIGPVVAPSYYGSRFASGLFYLPPTLMHVSRGLCGVHPFRWFCPPEVSILTLRSPQGIQS